MNTTILAFFAGLALLLAILWDAFETMVLPRRVTRRIRLARLFYRMTWRPWSAVARLLRRDKRRESFLSFFGPLSLLFLLNFWAVGLILRFRLLQYGLGSAVEASVSASNFLVAVCSGAATVFTL